MKLVALSLLFVLLMSCALTEEEVKKRDWYLNYGAYYYEGQRYPQAEEMVNKAREIDPENLKADLMLGFIYHFSGRYKHAETKFSEILENNPSNIKAHHGIAINYFQQGNQKRKVGIEYEGEKESEFTNSLKHFTRAVNSVDSVDWNPVLNYQISLVHTQIGLDHFGYQTRILNIQKKMQQQNSAPLPEKTEAPKPEDLIQKEKEERVLQQVVEFAQESGKPLEDAFESLAQKHRLKGDSHFSTAIRYLETHDQFLATQLTTFEEELKEIEKGKNFSYEQKHEAKQTVLDRKSKVIEARATSTSAIAMLHFRLQAFDEALEVLQRITKFDPTNPMVHLNTGLTLIRKAQQAEEALQNPSSNDPEYLRVRNDLIESLYLKAQDELNLYLAKQQVGQPQMILMVKNVLSNLENRNTITEKVVRNNS